MRLLPILAGSLVVRHIPAVIRIEEGLDVFRREPKCRVRFKRTGKASDREVSIVQTAGKPYCGEVTQRCH